MKRKPKWLRKLNKADRDHLKDGLERVTLRGFRVTIAFQRKHGITCRYCNDIAHKLGI